MIESLRENATPQWIEERLTHNTALRGASSGIVEVEGLVLCLAQVEFESSVEEESAILRFVACLTYRIEAEDVEAWALFINQRLRRLRR